MKNILHKLYNYSPAQIIKIIKNKISVPNEIPSINIPTDELNRLRKLPRYQETDTALLGHQLRIIDAESYLSMIEEIFVKKNYNFIAKRNDPIIIDCGSNIGLSIIFFKQIYPNAKIIGFEPDKKAFIALKKNIKNFNLTNIKLYEKAVWDKEETNNFLADGSWGGRIIDIDDKQTTHPVESTRLKKYLNGKIDFLKIDIEGAEKKILPDIKKNLNQVDNLFIECHSQIGQPQFLHNILKIIAHAGLRYHVKEASPRNNVFTKKIEKGFDSQIDIFAYRSIL